MCVCGGEWSVSHVVGSQEPDEAVVWFGRLSQVVRYQLIGWVKHLYSRRARGRGRTAGHEFRTNFSRPVNESGHLCPH